MSNPATEVAVRATELAEPILSQGTGAAPVMTDDEISRTYRVAKALAASHLYDDVKSAEQGFAKLLIGRTLGLNEHQSLSLYVMEGGVEVPYPLLGQFVRAREGYDYRPGWIKESFWAQVKGVGSGRVVSKTTTASGTAYVIVTDDGEKIRCKDSEIELMTAERETVWVDEEDPADDREIVGGVIQYTINGEVRGHSRWTREDSERANLLKPNSNHTKYPRNMYLARCQSNGVKWLLPECIAGLPVYALGELPRAEDLGAGEGRGEGPGWGEVAPAAVHEVERLIRRAEKVGYAALADRDVWQMKLRGQLDPAVAQMIQEGYDELAKVEGATEATAVEVDESTPEERGTPQPEGVNDDGSPITQADLAPEFKQAQESDAKQAYFKRSELLEQQAEAQERGDADTVAEIQSQLDALTAQDDDQARLI